MVSNYIIFYETFATHIKIYLVVDDLGLRQEADLGLASHPKEEYNSARRAWSDFGKPAQWRERVGAGLGVCMMVW